MNPRNDDDPATSFTGTSPTVTGAGRVPGVALGQLEAGTVFAGYRIDAVLGRGGMGTVYVATHPRLPRRDVLKLLSPSFSDDPNFRARFEREADLAGSLEHRNIVSVYDRGAEYGQLWIAMRYVRGYDASSLIAANPSGVDAALAVHIVSEIGNALDHAHRRGMVHRDVKPANILIESDDDGVGVGAIMLTDFGIARAVDDAMHLTDTGLTVASVPYASPEQLHGYELDGRSDIYALAATFVELVTGQPPFPRDNRLAAMSAHLHDDPPTVSDRVPGLPRQLDDVISRALAKSPADRYSTCAEFSYAASMSLGLIQSAPVPQAVHTKAFGPPAHAHGEAATAEIAHRGMTAAGVSDPDHAPPARMFSPAGNPDNATQVVPEARRARPSAPDALAHKDTRKTTVLVALATVLALIGLISGVLAFLNRAPAVGAWEAKYQPIADTFPRLLPAGPAGRGWKDAPCASGISDGLTTITCDESTGVRFTVWSTPTPQARRTVAVAVGNRPGTARVWSQGPVSVSADSVTDGWVITNFADPRRSAYTVVATWPGHSGQEVLDNWWRGAPFGT